jgi:hypothetical protein
LGFVMFTPFVFWAALIVVQQLEADSHLFPQFELWPPQDR